MITMLDDLLNDGRLARLFSQDARPCALQLWVLQIKCGMSVENRVIYGRLLPYSHSSGRWSASDDDVFEAFGEYQAQVRRLNLYVNSTLCAALLQGLSAGRNVGQVSRDLSLGFSDTLNVRFGTAALTAHGLTYRPVAYLLNRGAFDRNALSSPHDEGGALSAALTPTDKGALFCLGPDYDVALTASVVRQLNVDTGLDFGGADTARLGDLELLVFPTLDERGQSLLRRNWTQTPPALVVQFDPMQLPHFSGFQFRLSIGNNAQIIYSSIAMAKRDAQGLFVCSFALSEQLPAIADSTELEIFGLREEGAQVGTLCCWWRMHHVREIHMQGRVATHRASAVPFDWLEKVVRPSTSARVKTALTVHHSGPLDFTSLIGGRAADPWVPANRDLVSLFTRLHPPKSEGQFFLRGDEGRLRFAEWFKAQLAQYPQHQVVVFDPYFEDVGLDLLSLYVVSDADCIVFTSLPKPSKEGQPMCRKADGRVEERMNKLLASCKQNRHRLKRIKLRIYGLKDGRLHDRYILVTGQDGLLVAGFNLSNSLQAAAENHPLLVTPIPVDVLLAVEPYLSGLVREAQSPLPAGQAEDLPMRLVFDSTALPLAKPWRYEPLRLLYRAQAGDVLGVWTGEVSLSGLSGDLLKERMAELDLLRDESFVLPPKLGLRACLEHQAGDFSDFTTTWEVLGEVLAHSPTEDSRMPEVASERGFLAFLAGFLEAAFRRKPDDPGQSLTVVEPQFFRESVDVLLASGARPDHFSRAMKYTALTWPEFFAVKLLWLHTPQALVAIAEAQAARVPLESRGEDAMRLSLLSQMFSEIAVSVQFDISNEQLERLVHSRNGLLQWMGLNAIERQLEKPQGLPMGLQWVSAFDERMRVRALGWMVHRAVRKLNQTDICQGLIAALHAALPVTLSAEALGQLVDALRGHMRDLAWAEPCLSQDVVFPLLHDGRANGDDACEIWVRELTDTLAKEPPLLFERPREGHMTSVAAFLFSRSSPRLRQASVHSLQVILRRQRQIVQQPLASTPDEARWDNALVVSMWVLVFTQWGQYYLRMHDLSDDGLAQLSRDARALAMVRPMDEWRLQGVGKQGELAAFLDQVEELLASNEQSPKKRQ